MSVIAGNRYGEEFTFFFIIIIDMRYYASATLDFLRSDDAASGANFYGCGERVSHTYRMHCRCTSSAVSSPVGNKG